MQKREENTDKRAPGPLDLGGLLGRRLWETETSSTLERTGAFVLFTVVKLYHKPCPQPHVAEETCAGSAAQSCLTLCDPRDCSPPGSSVHGIFQARILERVAIS